MGHLRERPKGNASKVSLTFSLIASVFPLSEKLTVDDQQSYKDQSTRTEPPYKDKFVLVLSFLPTGRTRPSSEEFVPKKTKSEALDVARDPRGNVTGLGRWGGSEDEV